MGLVLVLQLAEAVSIAISRQQLHEIELAKLGLDATSIGPVARALQRDERLVRVRAATDLMHNAEAVQVLARLRAHYFHHTGI